MASMSASPSAQPQPTTRRLRRDGTQPGRQREPVAGHDNTMCLVLTARNHVTGSPTSKGPKTVELSRFSVNNGFRHLHSPSNGTPQMNLPLARGTPAGMQLCMGLRKRRRRHHCSGCQICSGSRVGSSGTLQRRRLGRDSACAFRHTSPRDARRLVGHGQMHVQPAESRPVKPPPVPAASVLGVSAASRILKCTTQQDSKYLRYRAHAWTRSRAHTPRGFGPLHSFSTSRCRIGCPGSSGRAVVSTGPKHTATSRPTKPQRAGRSDRTGCDT